MSTEHEPTQPGEAPPDGPQPSRLPSPRWAVILLVLGVLMLLLALGMQAPGPAYVGVVPLFYGIGLLLAARVDDPRRAQRRLASLTGLATLVLVFALGVHLTLGGEELYLDLGFGVLAVILTGALTGIHLAAKS